MRTLCLLLLVACTDPPGTRPWPHDDTADTGDTAPGEDTDTADTGVDTGWYGPATYPTDRTHSPLTPWVVERLRAIAAVDGSLQDDVFMKVGASSTVSSNNLACFVTQPVDLGAHDDLEPTLDWFAAGEADGSTPFDRPTEAAMIGRSAVWAISGDPSPVEQEIDAISPRFAIVHYGTNDMQLGTTYLSAMWGFHENLNTLLEQLIDQGIVPVVFGITARTDSTAANRWVGTYNAVIRGIAQSWQVPYVDLYRETAPLDGYGLSGDGLHLNSDPLGACVLAEEALDHGYNVRNLVSLEALDRMAAVVLRGQDALDEAVAPLAGEGAPGDPLSIESLPYADFRDTASSPSDAWDVYGCAGTDESGPELVYRLHLDQPTRLRALVLDRGDVDIDLHLLDASATPEGCLHRAHQVIQGTLGPGTYHFALDSWVDGNGTSREGEYLFVLVECDPDDPACDAAL